MTKYNVIENMLITDSFQIEFEHKINTIEMVEDIYLVLLKVPKGSKEVDNLYGIDKYGKIIWRVQNIKEAFDIPQNTPYIALRVLDSQKAQVTSFFGIRFTINTRNGKMIEKECIGW